MYCNGKDSTYLGVKKPRLRESITPPIYLLKMGILPV